MIRPSAFETRHTYTIHGAIASGGMGTIRLGLQLVARGFSRVVAIKQIHAMYANSQEFVGMFRDEYRVASRVVHPNVVPILDVVSADDELSLVMEYVHGLSVARLLTLAGSPPSPEIATTIVIGMLHGLHAAHEALSETGEHLNIVHRDVTPHNVMVGVDGAPRLLDFGIAHALGRSRTTQVGRIKGKAKYLAPEQLKGEPIDRRTDIYSASVVLWEMLTGRRLFGTGKDDPGIDLALRNSVEGPHLIRPGISPRLSRIVLRGLQTEPDARYATALEMAVALEESAATVSATKVGEWAKRVWGPAGLARLQQIRAIERGVKGVSEPDESWRRGHDHESTTVNGEIASHWEPSQAEMTLPVQFVGRLAEESSSEPTPLSRSNDSLFGAPRELPPFVERRPGKHPRDAARAETPSTIKGPIPVRRSRTTGRIVTVAVVLVALGSALALFVRRGAQLAGGRPPIAARLDASAALERPQLARIEGLPVIETMTTPSPSRLPPEGAPPSEGPSLGAPPDRTVAAAGAAPAVPTSDQRVTQTPRRRPFKSRAASGIAHPRGVSRKSLRIASARAVREPDEGNETAPPTLLVSPPCDPPYVIEDDGTKRFKLSCL